MTASRKMAVLIACLAFTACTQSQKDSASQDLDAAGTETKASSDKIRNYFDIGSKPKKIPVKPAQARYCYHTYEDIICYSRPIPGEEYRLVGFQNSAGKTGYTMPPETPPDTEVMPPLKSVYVGAPPEVKADDGQKHLKEIIFDPAELEPKELVPNKAQ